MARVRVGDAEVADLFRPGGSVDRIQYGPEVSREDLASKLGRGLDFADKAVKSPALGILGYGAAQGIHALSKAFAGNPEDLRKGAAEALLAQQKPTEPWQQGKLNSLDLSDDNLANMAAGRMNVGNAVYEREHPGQTMQAPGEPMPPPPSEPPTAPSNGLVDPNREYFQEAEIKRFQDLKKMLGNARSPAEAHRIAAEMQHQQNRIMGVYHPESEAGQPMHAQPQTPVPYQPTADEMQGQPPVPPIINPAPEGPVVQTTQTPAGEVRHVDVGDGTHLITSPNDDVIRLIGRGPDGRPQLIKSFTPAEAQQLMASQTQAPAPAAAAAPAPAQVEMPVADKASYDRDEVLALAAGADTPAKRAAALRAASKVEGIYGTTLADLLTGSHGAKKEFLDQVHTLLPREFAGAHNRSPEQTLLDVAQADKARAEIKRINADTTYRGSQRDFDKTKLEQQLGDLTAKHDEARAKLDIERAKGDYRKTQDEIKNDLARRKVDLEDSKLVENIRQFNKKLAAGAFKHPGQTINVITQQAKGLDIMSREVRDRKDTLDKTIGDLRQQAAKLGYAPRGRVAGAVNDFFEGITPFYSTRKPPANPDLARKPRSAEEEAAADPEVLKEESKARQEYNKELQHYNDEVERDRQKYQENIKDSARGRAYWEAAEQLENGTEYKDLTQAQRDIIDAGRQMGQTPAGKAHKRK